MKGVATAFDMDGGSWTQAGGYLPVENNPKLARGIDDFFGKKKRGHELIDIEPAMTEDFGYLLSRFLVSCSGLALTALVTFTIHRWVLRKKLWLSGVEELYLTFSQESHG